MSDQNTPDYGTRPEPKYGRYDDTHRIGDPYSPPNGPEWTPEQMAALRRALALPDKKVADGKGPRRDRFGIVLALILLAVATLATWGALNGGWWSLLWIIAVPFGLFGLVGLNIDGRKRVRDEDGRPVS